MVGSEQQGGQTNSEERQIGTLDQKWSETSRTPWRGVVLKDFIALASADGNQVLQQI